MLMNILKKAVHVANVVLASWAADGGGGGGRLYIVTTFNFGEKSTSKTGSTVPSVIPTLVTLMMEAIGSSETLVIYRSQTA
jgi:hypothetical protein